MRSKAGVMLPSQTPQPLLIYLLKGPRVRPIATITGEQDYVLNNTAILPSFDRFQPLRRALDPKWESSASAKFAQEVIPGNLMEALRFYCRFSIAERKHRGLYWIIEVVPLTTCEAEE